MGFYEEQVVPRITNLVLSGREIEQIRAGVAEGLEGEVLEVGFGSGRNVPHYPEAVKRVQAVDPSAVGRRLAAKRVTDSPVPVEYVGLDGEHLPLADASVDHALTTWTLCTIPDVGTALAEIRRVLRPGGTFHFVEHGLSPDPKVARWQHRLTPLERKIAGGCHLDRPIDALVAGSGLRVTALDTFHVKGPKTLGHMFQGVAVKE